MCRTRIVDSVTILTLWLFSYIVSVTFFLVFKYLPNIWIREKKQEEKISFSISSPSSKLTIFLLLFTNMILSTLLILAVGIQLDRTMVRLLPVRLLHSKVRLLHQISYFAPNISYFTPCCYVKYFLAMIFKVHRWWCVLQWYIGG